MTKHMVTFIKHAFPPPSFITMPGAGIDISSGSIRTIMLDDEHARIRLKTYQKIDLEANVITEGDIEQPDKLIEALRSLRLRERIHAAHVSLLEKKAYLYQTLVPKGVVHFRDAAEFSLEGNVPIPPGDVEFDYEVVRTIESGTIISVTAYAKRIVEAYRNVFEKAGVMLLSLETESQAALRAVIDPLLKKETVLLVDFGKYTTRIVVADCGVASFSTTIDVGGETLTNAIMKQRNISREEAEKIKYEKGFLKNENDAGIFEALMSTVSVLRDELLQHINYWNAYHEDDVPRRPITYVCVIGGGANLKGLPEFLSRMVALPVVVGNPWTNAFSLNEYIPQLEKNQSLQYATAIGLALQSKNGIW